MSHDDKVSKMIAELRARGVGKMTVAPPALQLAWKLGFKIPPPLFLSFGALATVMGVFFGIFWGIFMWFVLWSRQGLATGAAIVASLLAGLFFGIAMASYYRWKARTLGLPSWSEYEKKG